MFSYVLFAYLMVLSMKMLKLETCKNATLETNTWKQTPFYPFVFDTCIPWLSIYIYVVFGLKVSIFSIAILNAAFVGFGPFHGTFVSVA